MPRIIHGDDDQIVPVDTSASGGWPLAAWDGGGAVGGQPWHCPLAANLDSTANLEGDILERDPVTEVLLDVLQARRGRVEPRVGPKAERCSGRPRRRTGHAGMRPSLYAAAVAR